MSHTLKTDIDIAETVPLCVKYFYLLLNQSIIHGACIADCLYNNAEIVTM